MLAVLTVGLLLERGEQGQCSGAACSAIDLATQVGVAVVFATAAGILWSRLLPVLVEARFWRVMTFLDCTGPVCGHRGPEAATSGLIAVLAASG